MNFKDALYLVFFLSAGIAFLCPDVSVARQTIVNGTLGVGYDFWERTYDEEDNEDLRVDIDEGDRRDWLVSPEIELQSLGIHDSHFLRYAPVLRYDELFDTTDVDHYLFYNGQQFLTKKWRVELEDRFALTDDPFRYGTTFFSEGFGEPGEAPTDEQVGQPVQTQQPTEITQNLGRRRYLTNNLILQTIYTYAEDSDAGLGYAYRVLRNESDDFITGEEYDEYDRHEIFGLWSRKFSPSWRTQLDLSYAMGNFEDTEELIPPDVGPEEIPAEMSLDVDEYRSKVQLDYSRDSNNTFPLLYRFSGAQYEDLRQDIEVHEIAAGWDHAFDSRTRLVIGAGPSYVNAEDLDGEWGYNANIIFTRSYQHGEISALVDKHYELRNFTGSDDAGLSDLTDARIDLTYRFSQNVTGNLFGMYRFEDILNPQGAYYLSALGDRDPLSIEEIGDVTYSRDIYSAGASVDYAFLRWFVATLRYVYYQQDGDVLDDSFDEQRITFLISASKELWRR